MIQDFSITAYGRTVQFKMDLDPGYSQDAAILWYLQNQELPEPELCFLMLRVLQKGDFVVDGGANIGFFSLLAAACGAEVAAVEPCSKTAQKLCANLVLNSADNVTVCRQALSNVGANSIPLYLQTDSGENACWGDGEYERVAAVTLMTVCQGRWPRLVKLDIEGSELRALQGHLFVRTKRDTLFVVECNEKALARMGASVQTIRDYMADYGYDAFRLDPGGGIPTLIPRNAEVRPERPNSLLLLTRIEEVGRIWNEVRI